METEKSRRFTKLFVSFKRQFAFRLSVPSFIYPAGYDDNVRLLAPFVDEIELLLFESDESSLPPKSEIEALAALAVAHDISYNIHLPTDVDLAAAGDADRRQALERLSIAIDRVRPLSPTTHTLHLPYNEADTKASTIDNWVTRNLDGLGIILAANRLNPRQISIETLDYPPMWFKPIVTEIDLAVCIDIGHVLRYGYDLEKIWDLFGDRTTMVHLHGVCRGQDHLGLDRLPSQDLKRVQTCLSAYTGALSIEVFSYDRLSASLPCLAQMFPKTSARRDVDSGNRMHAPRQEKD